MNAFKKNLSTEEDSAPCRISHDQGLYLSYRFMSWIVAFFCLLMMSAFMLGYVLGKRHSIDALGVKIEQESIADQVYSSICTLYDSPSSLQEADDHDENHHDDIHEDDDMADADNTLSKENADIKKEFSETNSLKEATCENSIIENNEKDPRYYAQIIGFASLENAQRFVAKLKQHSLSLSIQKKTSKSSRGKIVVWYQIITESYSTKEALEKTIQTIRLYEKIHDIRIITV